MDIRKKEQSGTTVLVLSNYKNEVAIEQNGEYCENNTVRGKYLNSYQKSKLMCQVLSPIHESEVHGKGQGYMHYLGFISVLKPMKLHETTKGMSIN